jgi:hypothetical protein
MTGANRIMSSGTIYVQRFIGARVRENLSKRLSVLPTQCGAGDKPQHERPSTCSLIEARRILNRRRNQLVKNQLIFLSKM